jgi:hypothetical protein
LAGVADHVEETAFLIETVALDANAHERLEVTPARDVKVGRRSIAAAIGSILRFGGIRTGHRRNSGDRAPPLSTLPLRPFMPPFQRKLAVHVPVVVFHHRQSGSRHVGFFLLRIGGFHSWIEGGIFRKIPIGNLHRRMRSIEWQTTEEWLFAVLLEK